MKLSELKGEKVLDTIADLVEPIASIAMDDEAAAIFKRQPLSEGEDFKSYMANKLRKSIPKLLKTHRDDIITILATMTMTDIKEYKKNMTVAGVIRDFMSILSDTELLDFFG